MQHMISARSEAGVASNPRLGRLDVLPEDDNGLGIHSGSFVLLL